MASGLRATVRFKLDFSEVRTYLAGVARRSHSQIPWMRTSCRAIFGSHQREIWNRCGAVPGSPVNWVEWGKRYGNPSAVHNEATGLTILRQIIRTDEGSWTGRKTDILRDTGHMKQSVGPQLISHNIFEWGIAPGDDWTAYLMDQMWNVEKGSYWVKIKQRIPDTKTLGRGAWAWTQIPARPFVFATEPFASKLASNLAAYIHHGTSGPGGSSQERLPNP